MEHQEVEEKQGPSDWNESLKMVYFIDLLLKNQIKQTKDSPSLN